MSLQAFRASQEKFLFDLARGLLADPEVLVVQDLAIKLTCEPGLLLRFRKCSYGFSGELI